MEGNLVKIMTHNHHTDEEELVEARQKRLENRMENGLRHHPDNKFDSFDDDWVRDYLTAVNSKRTEGTIGKYVSKLRKWTLFLSADVVDAEFIDARDFAEFLALREYNGSTINDFITVISNLHSYLNKHHGTNLPSISGLDGMEFSQATEDLERKSISRPKVEKLIESAGFGRYGFRNRVLVSFIYYTTARRQEAVEMKCEDIHLSEKYATIRDGKGGKRRDVPLCPEIRVLLRKWLEQKRDTIPAPESACVFVGESTAQISASRAYEIVMKAADKAGIQDKKGQTASGFTIWRVKPHVLRHSIANHMEEDGVPPEEIAIIMGHEDPSTTNKYYLDDEIGTEFRQFHTRFGGLDGNG